MSVAKRLVEEQLNEPCEGDLDDGWFDPGSASVAGPLTGDPLVEALREEFAKRFPGASATIRRGAR